MNIYRRHWCQNLEKFTSSHQGNKEPKELFYTKNKLLLLLLRVLPPKPSTPNNDRVIMVAAVLPALRTIGLSIQLSSFLFGFFLFFFAAFCIFVFLRALFGLLIFRL